MKPKDFQVMKSRSQRVLRAAIVSVLLDGN